MKKIILSLLFAFLLAYSAAAKQFTSPENILKTKSLKIHATVIGNFSTKQPSETLVTKISGNYLLNDKEFISNDTILVGDIIKVVPPKIGKKDAYAYYYLKSVKFPNNETYKNIKGTDAIIKISKYSQPTDIGDKVVNAASSTVNFLVKNISYPVDVMNGTANKENSNKFSNTDKKTNIKDFCPFLKKGKHLELQTGDSVMLTFTYTDDLQ